MGVAHGEGLAGKRPSADNCGEQLVFLQTGQKESDVLRPHPQIPGHTVPVDVVHPAGVMGEVVIQKQLERPHRQRVGREGQGDPASPVGVDKLDEISKRTGRTRNELIGIFLEYAANNCIVKDQEEP